MKRLVEFYSKKRINKVLLTVTFALLCAVFGMAMFGLTNLVFGAIEPTATLAAFVGGLAYLAPFIFGMRLFEQELEKRDVI